MDRYDDLRQTIEMFLREPVHLVFRNDPILSTLVHKLPSAWFPAVLSTRTVQEELEEIWGSVCSSNPVFCEHLRDSIRQLAIVITPSQGFLAYIFDVKSRLSAFLGGYPATHEAINEREEELGVQFPRAYRTFLTIHNGFLLNGWPSVGIKPLQKLFTIGEMIGSDIVASGQKITYDPWSLLCFCGDGYGNEQCFDYAANQPVESASVFWDHETRESGTHRRFDDFLLEFLRQELRIRFHNEGTLHLVTRRDPNNRTNPTRG